MINIFWLIVLLVKWMVTFRNQKWKKKNILELQLGNRSLASVFKLKVVHARWQYILRSTKCVSYAWPTISNKVSWYIINPRRRIREILVMCSRCLGHTFRVSVSCDVISCLVALKAFPFAFVIVSCHWLGIVIVRNISLFSKPARKRTTQLYIALHA